MFVIEVIPLTRGSQIDTLSYYSGVSYPAGVIIEVPVRKSLARAMVTDVRPVSAARTAVRAATFSLKKLPEQTATEPLPAALIETAKALTKTYPAKLGAILYALLPPEVRDGTAELEHTTPVSHADIRPEFDVLQGTFDDRMLAYKSKIREVFAHRGSVLFVVPTSADIERVKDILSHGIEKRIVTFSGTNTKKKSAAAFAAFYDLTKAKLILTTPSYAYLDRHDITHIIIEQSRSRHYKSRVRPYLDHRDALIALAHITNRTITFGDLLPRSEEEYKRREDFYNTHGEQPKRISFDSSLEVIEQKDKPTAQEPFQLVAPKVLRGIEETIQARGRVFLYAARRGLAPVVVCNDCGHIFRCPDSGSPYSLFRTQHDGEEQRWFLCPTSGKRIRASDTCSECGSWRLRERGIGIQHIESEIKNLFPNTPVLIFDHATANTFRKAQNIIGEYYDTKGAILIGTQMALSYLDKPISTSVITSFDAARSIPSWRAEEEFFALLLTLRDMTAERVYIQTRSVADELTNLATRGLVEQFYTSELDLREQLKYPPFATFILLSWQATKESVEETEAVLAEQLAAYKPRFYSAPHSLREKTLRHGLIRVPQLKWPLPELIELLRSLPPNIKIEVNPDRIV
ncbi:hypothetical protein N9L26_01220 [Candidatus Pacebacteria bacterium]|nr:hypothetical protein [Candidatus Paceibacterota bacterium]